MPAFARLVIYGIAYHVTQRGNYRQDVFVTDEDREAYLGYVASAALAYGSLPTRNAGLALFRLSPRFPERGL